jgi:RNA polymerase sigma-70 factor, ECF subfamily
LSDPPYPRGNQRYGRILESYYEDRTAVYRYLLSKTGDVDRAEDLTQDVFTAALAAAPVIESDPRPLLPWLYAVAHRKLVDYRRSERGRAMLCSALEAFRIDPASEPIFQPIRSAAIGDAIRSLPPAQRRVCVMRLFEGRSFADIGTELHATETACRMRFERALRSLRRLLEGIAASILITSHVLDSELTAALTVLS